MGKRKAKTISPRHTEVQCDVWLTAKPPKKQKVLSRGPLHVYNGQTRDEPTLITVPMATKQTTLSDFFGKRRDLMTDKTSLHSVQAQPKKAYHNGDKPPLHYTDHHRISHQMQSTQEHVAPDVRIAEFPVKQREPESGIRIFCNDLASHNQDENVLDGCHSNPIPTNPRPSNTEHRDSCQVQESERNVLDGKLRNTEENNMADSVDEDYKGDDDVISVDADRKTRLQRGRGTDKDAFLKQRTRFCDFPTHGNSSHLPYVGLSKSTEASSDEDSINAVHHPCKITFVPLKDADSSQETELESSTVDRAACSYHSMTPLGEPDTQLSLNINMLRYIDPVGLDTVPMPDSQTQSTDSDELITTHSLAESDTNPSIRDFKVVDPVLLEVNTADISTEEEEPLSGGDRVDNDPALLTGQSLVNSLEFAVSTQGCWVLKRPPSTGDMDDCEVYDSQMF